MEQAVIEARQQLEATPYARIGAEAVDWQLKQQGNKRPAIATINRVIDRNNLTRKKPPRYNPKGLDYPSIEIERFNQDFDKLFLRTQAVNFEVYRENHHRYSTLMGIPRHNM